MKTTGNASSSRGMATLVAAVVAALCLALSMLVFAGCGSSGSSSSQTSGAADESAASSAAANSDSSAASSQASADSAGYTTEASGKFSSGKHTATVKVKGQGSFRIELDADDAPVTVANFAKLANDGYYDGLAFYRVVSGFCLQGGTKGNTASGSDSSLTPIVGEFSGNNVENALADDFHKGTVAMARTSEPNSATSTFFITLASSDAVSQSLDGQYAAFGTVGKAGMKTVDKIVKSCKSAKADSMGVISSEKDMPIIQSIRVK